MVFKVMQTFTHDTLYDWRKKIKGLIHSSHCFCSLLNLYISNRKIQTVSFSREQQSFRKLSDATDILNIFFFSFRFENFNCWIIFSLVQVQGMKHHIYPSCFQLWIAKQRHWFSNQRSSCFSFCHRFVSHPRPRSWTPFLLHHSALRTLPALPAVSPQVSLLLSIAHHEEEGEMSQKFEQLQSSNFFSNSSHDLSWLEEDMKPRGAGAHSWQLISSSMSKGDFAQNIVLSEETGLSEKGEKQAKDHLKISSTNDLWKFSLSGDLIFPSGMKSWKIYRSKHSYSPNRQFSCAGQMWNTFF